MFSTSIDQIQKYQVTPIQMLNNKSLSKYTLENSIQNIKKQQKKNYLNILITNIEYLELFGNCISFCKIGITGISLQQKKIITEFYSNRVLIVDQSIKNAYIDIIITENKDLLNILIHKNYIKYIYAINNKFTLQYYKIYQSSIPNSYFYINRLGIDAYKKLQFKLDNINSNQKIKQEYNLQQNININKEIKVQQKKNIIKQKQYLSDKNTVSLIIPFYNNQKVTIKLLKTIQRYSVNSKYKINIILISDGSEQKIVLSILNQLKKYKNIKYQILINQKRLGYIKSINIGIKKALQNQSQYIMLMHNDIQVSYNWQDLISNINSQVIGTCPLTNSIYDLQQSIKYIRANNILKDFPPSFQKCKTLTINEMLSKYKNKNIQLSKQTFIPNFFCIAFDAEIFNKLGLLDQSFGQGFGQNINFLYKIYNSGYKINFIPSVYIPHIGRTTFKDLYKINEFEEQVKIRQNLNKFSINLNNEKKKKKVIYTCITNNYDSFPKHTIYNTQQFDYILFGQNLQNIQKPWIYVDISQFKNGIKTNNPVKIVRFFKTHPHLFFRNYQQSIWIDENINIIVDPSNISQLLPENEYLLIPQHSTHKSVYTYAQVCKVENKDQHKNIDKILKFLNQNNFKDSTPLVQSYIIIRKHNNINCKKLMENWWKLIFKYSQIDQLSFNYCLQKSCQQIISIDQNIINNKYIKQNSKHGNIK